MNFTEIPLHILDLFFNLYDTHTPDKNTVFGDFYIIDAPLSDFGITIKTSNRYENVRISTPDGYDTEENQIAVQYRSGTMTDVANGDDVYFRKGGELYSYLARNESYNYINTNKDYLYLGKIYTHATNVYFITINSFYHFIKKALPENNRTTRILEFLKLGYDRVYPEIYFKQSNTGTLIDPRIVNIDYLSYLAGFFDISLNQDFVNFNKDLSRIFVSNLPNYLKRKGTYSSIYIAANSILSNTANSLNVYERWHDIFDWATDPNPLDHFVDFNYLNYYSKDTSGNTLNNILIDSDKTQGGIPTEISNDVIIHKQTIDKMTWYVHHSLNSKGFILQCYDGDYNRITPTAIQYVSNYIVKLTFSVIKNGYCFLVKPEAQASLPSTTSVWNFAHNLDTAFPMSTYTDTSHYTIDVTDEGITDGDTIIVYPPDTNAGIGYAIEPNYIHTQNTPTSAWNFTYTDTDDNDSVVVQFLITEPQQTFTITHNLNTENVLVQCYDQSTKKLVYPISMVIDDEDNVSLAFAEVFDGFVVICLSDYNDTHWTVESTWRTDHTISDEFVLSQYFKSTKSLISESYTLPVSTGVLSTTFSESLSGYVQLAEADYYEEITEPLTTWEINHDLDNFCCLSQVFSYTSETSASTWNILHELNSKDLIIQCYDSNNILIEPTNIDLISDDSVEITLATQNKGYILISAANTNSFPTSAVVNIETYDDYVLFQLYDNDYELVDPYSVTQTDDTLSIMISPPTSGYVNITEADFIHYQDVADTDWLIKHHFSSRDMITQFYSGNTLVEADELEILSNDLIKATFSVATSGIAIVNEADGHYTFMDKVIPKNITIVDDDNIQVNFDTASIGHVVVKESDFIGRYVEKAIPDTLTLDSNNVQATFSSANTGYAMIKYVGSVGYHEQLIQSPHFKVELNLSNYPYDTNAILNENKSSMFVTTLDVVKPVAKYAHYEYMLNPYCDFTDTIRTLYGNSYDAECSSFCTHTTFTSAASASYIHPQYTTSSEWIIYHNLNNDVIVQCFDNSDTKIQPSNVQKISNDVVKISWASNTVGYVLVSEIDKLYTQTAMPSASNWEIGEYSNDVTENTVYYLIIDGSNYMLIDESHYFEIYAETDFAPIIQIYDKKLNQIFPDIHSYTQLGIKYVTIEFDQKTPGYALLEDNITILQPTVAQTWTINHNSGISGLICQFFDDNGYLMEPSELVLTSENTLTATFNEAVSGTLLIRTVGNKYTNESIVYNINNSGYIKFGTGTDLDNYNAKTANAIKTPLTLSGSDITVTPTVTDTASNNYVTIQGLLKELVSGAITECGVYDQDDNLMFYSFFDTIYKQTNTDFNFTLKIYRQEL